MVNPDLSRCVERVFNEMGSGHSETVYEACLMIDLAIMYGEPFSRQVPCTLKYRGYPVGVGFIDILFFDTPIELKAVSKLTPKDEQQVRKYLEALDLDYGLIINFGTDLEIVEVERGNHGKTPSAED